MISSAFALSIPTALLRTPRLLSYLSAVGTAATACIVLAVAGSAIHYGDITERLAKSEGLGTIEAHELWNGSGISIAFGLIAFTFSGHAIIPNIYSSMAKPQEYERMIGFTFVCVTTCCLIVAASGYFMFGTMVDDQITLSLQETSGDNNIIMKILTWLMILTAFSKFTLTAFPLGLGIEEIIAPYLPSDKAMEYVSSLIKIMLIGAALAVAIFVPSFSFLCSLVGLICTMMVSVIFPAAAHLKMFGPRLSLKEKILDWLFVVGGSIIAIAGTINSV
jgi:vesicular inhibitory amino acid transporter